jgi:iron complex outermembrane receptor protein
LRFRLAQNDYSHTELEGGAIGTIFDAGGLDARLEWRHGHFGPFEGTLGLQSKNIDFNAIGDEAFVPQSTTKQTSLFAFEEWSISDRFVMQGSGRIERQTIITQTFLADYRDNAFGGSIGMVWLLNGQNSIAVNYALTERHPNATELFADGAHVAIDRIERGSVVLGTGILERELSSNIDIALRGDSERVEWEVALFINDIDDYILLSPTAALEDNLQVFEYRQTSARLAGFEAEARIELFETTNGHLHTRLFSDYVRGENRSTNEKLPRIPPLRYGAGLHYTTDRFEAGLELRIHQKQHRVASNELPTDAYALLSAELSYVWSDPDILVFLRAKNLGDEDARQHTSPLKESFPLPGRSLQLGFRYDF